VDGIARDVVHWPNTALLFNPTVSYPALVPKITDHEAALHWLLPKGARPRDVKPELFSNPVNGAGDRSKNTPAFG
jgi:hypothetical protein